MINDWIRQLQDPDPNKRRQAIIAIGKSKDASALKSLAAVVNGDPDADLRELARKAGQYIRQQAKQQTHEAHPDITPIKKSADSRIAPLSEKPAPRSESDEPVAPATLRFQQLVEQQSIEDPDLEDLNLADSPPTSLYTEEEYAAIYGQPRETETSRAPVEESVTPEKARLTPVRGRQYNVTKADIERAKQYTDAALSLNIDGNNAKAMKNLTEALSLNPNLINDGYFTGVANAVTGLEGDESIQMIIDRGARKQFTQSAAKEQKNRRIEKHMGEAVQSTWVDFWFELIIYSLIVIIGPILAMLVLSESANNLLNTLAQAVGELPPELETAQATFTGVTFGSLLPIGVISGLSAVFSLLLQTVLIHFLAKLLGGTGTWRHLIKVLLGFYNKWFPILFFFSYVTIAFMFFSHFSPVIFCFIIVLVILALYVSGKTSGKIGEAYDFGGAMGCVTLVLSGLVIFAINAVLGYVLGQAFGLALNSTFPPV